MPRRFECRFYSLKRISRWKQLKKLDSDWSFSRASCGAGMTETEVFLMYFENIKNGLANTENISTPSGAKA